MGEHAFVGEQTKEMARGICIFLDALADYLGMDRKDPNFIDTPMRVAKAYKEICGGGYQFEKRCDEVLATAFPNERGYRQMVFQDNIVTAGICPHHLLPVEYTIHVAYIPGEKIFGTVMDGRVTVPIDNGGFVTGLSKLARIAVLSAARPVLQETVTQDILTQLEKLRPAGVGVFVRGQHNCMRIRGVKQPYSSTTTTAFSGAFMSSEATRAEFMGLVHESNSRRF